MLQLLKDLSLYTSTKFRQHHQLHWTDELQNHPQPSVQSYPELSGSGKAPWCFSAKSTFSRKAELTWLFKGFLDNLPKAMWEQSREVSRTPTHQLCCRAWLLITPTQVPVCLSLSHLNWYSTYLEHLPKPTFTVISAAFLYHPWI